MVKKTKQDIARTCFAWQPTHKVRPTRKTIAWFEILRTNDGTGQTTTFNAMADTRSATDENKCYGITHSIIFVADALRPISELGIKANGSFFDPVVIDPPPEWLDRFFETLAGLLDNLKMSLDQITEEDLNALGQEAYITVITPDPPKPPQFAGTGWKKGGAL